MKNVLSFDFGASSGRAILGNYDGFALHLKEICRFENEPIIVDGTLYWDIDVLFGVVKKVLKNIGNKMKIDSIGIDTWGVDFGLLDKDGRLLNHPVHYRDQRTEGLLEEVEKLIPKEKLYELTGNQIIFFNTIYQLAYLKKYKEDELKNARSLLLMPDLFNYLLTGEQYSEMTIASTTQLFDPYKKEWHGDIIKILGLPIEIFNAVVDPGKVIGTISEGLAKELGIPQIPVVATTSHDTASAVVSVPASEKDFLFVSCGTWSLIGTELEEPIINAKSASYNITNESGINGTTRFLKNVTGLWMLEETKKQLEKEGRVYSYDEITELAERSQPFSCYVNTDHPDFQLPGNMPAKIKDYAKMTYQRVPETDGEIFRVIYESLALKYRDVFEEIMACTGKRYSQVHIVGGGSQAGILCQMVANASEIEVVAGPVEATVIGNSIVQLLSQNTIANLAEARKVVRRSFETKTYYSVQQEKWDVAFRHFKDILREDVKGEV